MQVMVRRGRRWILLLLTAVWVGGGGGCHETTPPPLTWEEQVLERRYGDCGDPSDGPCVEVIVKYVEFAGPPGPAAQLNRSVHRLLLGVTGPTAGPEAFAEDVGPRLQSLDRARGTPRIVEVEYRVIHHDDQVVSVEVASTLDRDLAPDLPSRVYGTFSTDHGNPVTLGEMLQLDYEAPLTALAEKRFREINQIPDGQSLEEAGVRFSRGSFALTDNCAVTADGLVFHYHYRMGTELTRAQVVLTREELVGLAIPTGPLGSSR